MLNNLKGIKLSDYGLKADERCVKIILPLFLNLCKVTFLLNSLYCFVPTRVSKDFFNQIKNTIKITPMYYKQNGYNCLAIITKPKIYV